LESFVKKPIEENTQKEEQGFFKVEESKNLSKETISLAQLNRIESKQNVILEILESTTQATVSQVKIRKTSSSDEEILKLNLKLFNSRLIILSTAVENKYIHDFLVLLEEISEHLSSNSFNIFTKEKSPVKLALRQIVVIGMGDSILNDNLEKAEKLLQKIDNISKMHVFEKNYGYANIFLEKNMLLNSITLLNEATGMYIVESIKKYSKEIEKYTYIVGEEDRFKLYIQAKEFFDALFSSKNKERKQIQFFPHHRIVKDIDKDIAKKLINIQRTWKNKGDSGVFQKYVFITNRVRFIRNSVAHADMESNFKSLKDELKSLNDDFYYLVIQKNILKK
jgi:hypothetical protein